ncbi:MAG TPA: ATP-binding protein [Alphaproteobacteria bacterium]
MVSPTRKPGRGLAGLRLPRLHPVRTYIVAFLLGLAPIMALGVYAYRIAAAELGMLIRSNNVGVATITRELVEREFEYRINTLAEFAQRRDFRISVRNRDEEAVRAHLENLVEGYQRVVRAFVTTPEGTLWSDFPKAEESLGRNFAYRDWYKGLSVSWQPYVSGVYRRNARPQLLLVAVAVPVRDVPGNEVVGALVYQITLEGLTNLLRQVEVGREGFVVLLDHTGTVAAHPRLDLQEREYREYAKTEPVAAVVEAQTRNVEYEDPLARKTMLATAIPILVQGKRWIVIAQQPLSEAFRPLRQLGFEIAAAGALLLLMLTSLLFGLARYHNRAQSLNVRFAELNKTLSKENQERRRAEQKLKEANDELERRVEERTRELREKEDQLLQTQKMEAIGRLAGGVAHDFNNLLTIIMGYSEIILRTLRADHPLKARIEQIHNAGQRASSLTKQLLAFSRKQVLQPEILDVNSVVGNMDTMLRRLIGEDIDLYTKLGPDLDPVRFDPSQIEQIIMNLAINARDAMPNGGKLTVETANVELDEEYARTHAEARVGPHVMIAMTDTGIGMDAETRAHIFEPFFTTKGLGKGTGLGLSTVYGIVKQSGGNIWVYSEPGHGTTFKVYLPRAEGETIPVKPRPEAPAVMKGTETILVVEDQEDVRSFIRDVLRMGGYTILDTGDVDQAVKICEEYGDGIDLLLTDVVLPKMSGRNLADILTAKRVGLKVVYMSGYTDDAIVHQGVLDPGTDFLEKPIKSEALLRMVRRSLTQGGSSPKGV